MASHSSAAIRWIVGFGSLALALLFLTLGSRALQEREALWQLQLASQSELQQLALLSTRQRQAAQAQLLGETLAADAWVVELVRQAHALEPADPALTSIRNQLYTRLVPRWRNLQPSHPFRLLVHLAPAGEVFLRVHAPERHGDNLSDRHPILRDALRSGTSRAGLDLSLQGLGMRAVTPLRVDSLAGPLTVGAIEVVYEVLGELQQLDRELNAGVALLLQPPVRVRDGEALRGLEAEPGGCQLIGSSRPQVQAWQAAGLLPAPAAGYSRQLLEDQGRSYLLNQFVLPGYPQDAGSPTTTQAIALVWRDISELAAIHRRDQRQLVGKWLLAWLGAAALLLLLLLATKRSSQILLSRHRDELQAKHRQSEQARQLLAVIAETQAAYINAQNQREAFDALLKRILVLSDSQFGLIGEVLHDGQGAPYLRAYAVSYQASRDLRRADQSAPDLDELLEQALHSNSPLLRNMPSAAPQPAGPAEPSPLLQAFAGLPIHANGQLIGMLGLANRAGGYDQAFVEFLQPLLATLGQLIEALRRDIQREQAQHSLQRQQ